MAVKGDGDLLHNGNNHRGGANGRASQIREKYIGALLDFQTEVPVFLNEALWLVSEQFYFFFFLKKTQLRNKVKIIYTTKQHQKDCPSPTFMLVFIHKLGSSAVKKP